MNAKLTRSRTLETKLKDRPYHLDQLRDHVAEFDTVPARQDTVAIGDVAAREWDHIVEECHGCCKLARFDLYGQPNGA